MITLTFKVSTNPDSGVLSCELEGKGSSANPVETVMASLVKAAISMTMKFAMEKTGNGTEILVEGDNKDLFEELKKKM